jgi:hypothetical protein
MLKMQKIPNLLLLVGRDHQLVYFIMLSPQGVFNLVKMTNLDPMSKMNKLGTMKLPSLFDFSYFQCSSPIAYLQPSVSMTIARGDKAIVSCKGFNIYAKGGSIGGVCAKHELLKPSATRTKEHIGKDI